MADTTQNTERHDGYGHRYDFDKSVQGYGICECGARENSEMSVRECPVWSGAHMAKGVDGDITCCSIANSESFREWQHRVDEYCPVCVPKDGVVDVSEPTMEASP